MHRLHTRTRSALFQCICRESGEVHGIKVYPREMRVSDILTEAVFGDALNEGGIRATQYLRGIDSLPYVCQADGTFAIAYRWLEGTTDSPPIRSYLHGVGLVLAAAHRSGPEVRSATGDWLWRDCRAVIGRTPESRFRRWAMAVKPDRCPWRSFEAEIVVHNDVTPQNVLWRANDPIPALVDLTNCISAPLEWDVATAWAAAAIWHPEFEDGQSSDWWLDVMLKAYESAYRPLNRFLLNSFARIALAQRGLFALFLGDRDSQFLWRLAEVVEDTVR